MNAFDGLPQLEKALQSTLVSMAKSTPDDRTEAEASYSSLLNEYEALGSYDQASRMEQTAEATVDISVFWNRQLAKPRVRSDASIVPLHALLYWSKSGWRNDHLTPFRDVRSPDKRVPIRYLRLFDIGGTEPI
jgi:hypothetical protein